VPFPPVPEGFPDDCEQPTAATSDNPTIEDAMLQRRDGFMTGLAQARSFLSSGRRLDATGDCCQTDASMPVRSTALMLSSLGALALFACTYRTDMLAGVPPGGQGGSGMGGAPATGGITVAGGTTGTGGSSVEDARACTTDDDCLQCVYATAPNDTGECENALGCCGGPVMNQTACAKNKAAWQAHCADRGYTPPICPCIVCGGPLGCRNGRCGYWDC
jgi:hypothetical protein